MDHNRLSDTDVAVNVRRPWLGLHLNVRIVVPRGANRKRQVQFPINCGAFSSKLKISLKVGVGWEWMGRSDMRAMGACSETDSILGITQ